MVDNKKSTKINYTYINIGTTKQNRFQENNVYTIIKIVVKLLTGH